MATRCKRRGFVAACLAALVPWGRREDRQAPGFDADDVAWDDWETGEIVSIVVPFRIKEGDVLAWDNSSGKVLLTRAAIRNDPTI